jgi:hypothetical protein
MALDSNASNSWQPPVDASQVRQAQGQATLPSAAADDSGREPVSASPVNDQLQSPTARPATPPMQLQPGVTTPAVPPSSNPRLHGFIGSVLSGTLKALAGRPAVRYTTDADGKVIADPNQPQDTNADRGRRLAAHALQGLAAGAQVPQQKSGLASALAGMGAGANAVTASATAQDDKAKQEARENQEAAEQKKLRAYQIGHLNATTYAEIQNAKAKGEEGLKAHYQDTQDLLDAAKEGGVETTVMSPEQGAALIAKEKAAGDSAVVKHVVVGLLPPKPVLENGQPILDEYGNPKMEKQIAVITEDQHGDPMDPTGKTLVMSDAVVKRIQRVAGFAHLSGIDSLKAGDTIPWKQFESLITATKHAENQITAAKPEIVQVDDGKGGKKLQRRNALGELSNPSADEELSFQERQAKLAKEQQDVQTGKSTEAKNYAEAKKALADSSGTSEEVSGQAIDLVEGDMDPSNLNRRSKSYNDILSAARKYSVQKYGKPFDVAKATSDYKFATNVQTQNTLKFLNSLTGPDNKSGNLQALIDASNNIDRTDFPPLNNADAWLKITTGDPQMAAYKTAVLEVADQAAKILQGGGSGAGTSDAKLRQAQELFDVKFTKKQTQAISETLRTLLGNRKKEMIGDNRYLLKQYSQQAPSQNPATEQLPPGVPQGATHIYKDANQKVVGYALDGKYVPIQAGKQ